jgi:hypothetical protein
MRRNIVSILKRIAPSVRPERALIILPCTGGLPAAVSASAAGGSIDDPEPS